MEIHLYIVDLVGVVLGCLVVGALTWIVGNRRAILVRARQGWYGFDEGDE